MYIIAAIMYISILEAPMAGTSSIRHKHVRIDQAKLDKAKKVFRATTDTEALDRALTLVVSEADVDRTLRRVARKGQLKKLFP